MAKEFNLEEQVYIAKYYEKIKLTELSNGLGVTSEAIRREVERQKENGLYEQYKKLSDEEYEAICKKAKKE